MTVTTPLLPDSNAPEGTSVAQNGIGYVVQDALRSPPGNPCAYPPRSIPPHTRLPGADDELVITTPGILAAGHP